MVPDLRAVNLFSFSSVSEKKKLSYFELGFDYLLLISANSIETNATKKLKAFCSYKQGW